MFFCAVMNSFLYLAIVYVYNPFEFFLGANGVTPQSIFRLFIYC